MSKYFNNIDQLNNQMRQIKQLKCRNCGDDFPAKVTKDGRTYHCYNRKYCYNCSPLGARNSRILETVKNGETCIHCDAPLTNRKTRFCSKTCKSRWHMKWENCKEHKTMKGIRRKYEIIKERGGKCEVCGYNKNMAGITFHHIDPEIKSFTLDLRSLSNRSMSSILEEVEKCRILCHSCHAEEHNKSMDLNFVEELLK